MEMESSSSSSCKRAKAPAPVAVVGQGQAAHCLVDGCEADLSVCRDYHRRHKVCEAHSKAPKVTIRGREHRFCQQCSRFHSLVEFDEGKRSCRKRLDGHNFISTFAGTQHALQGGRTLVSFTTPHNSPWTGGLNHEKMPQLYNTTTYTQLQHQHHNNYINSDAGRSRQIINSSSSSSFHLQNEYSCDGALSLLSVEVEGETSPPSNLHYCHYPAFPQPPGTHHHESSSSSSAASHHTRTFTWNH